MYKLELKNQYELRSFWEALIHLLYITVRNKKPVILCLVLQATDNALLEVVPLRFHYLQKLVKREAPGF